MITTQEEGFTEFVTALCNCDKKCEQRHHREKFFFTKMYFFNNVAQYMFLSQTKNDIHKKVFVYVFIRISSPFTNFHIFELQLFLRCKTVKDNYLKATMEIIVFLLNMTNVFQ